MIKLGDYNTLKIVKRVDFGMYLLQYPEDSKARGLRHVS